MERIELELDDETLAHARNLAEARRCSLEDLLKGLIHQQAGPIATADTILGLFADEPELLDDVVESAMLARERDPLRQAFG